MRRGKATRRIIRSIRPKTGTTLKTGRVKPLSRLPRNSYTKRKSFKLK